MAQKRQHQLTATSSRPAASSSDVFESLPIHDRGSVFIAIFSTSPTYISNPKLLQAHEPFKDAMHRMLAYRRESKQTSLSFQTSSTTGPGSATEPKTTTSKSTKPLYATASDEDGERYAGKKLEKLLVDVNMEGVVVVARWYGGILLGPVRFDHIINAAKDAIEKWKDSHISHRDDERASKRTKLEPQNASVSGQNIVDEAKEKKRLVQVLHERDASVTILRGLLAEKSENLKKAQSMTARVEEKVPGGDGARNDPVSSSQATAPPSSTPTSSQAAKLEYDEMPLQRLKQLEKARDASLAWILKQIDATETKIGEAEKQVPKPSSIQDG